MGVMRTREISLGIDAFKVSLENVLLNANVEVVIASLPTENIVMDGAIRGVVIGNKSGRQALLGSWWWMRQYGPGGADRWRGV